jgi:hypothetical protein
MFFLFPEVIENKEDISNMPRDYFKALIHLNDNKWLLILRGSEKLAEAMTKNFLGQEGSVDEPEIADVFREAVNVIAGNFLMKLGGRKRISLGVPEVEKCRKFRRDETQRDFIGGLLFNVDDEFCDVYIKGIDT